MNGKDILKDIKQRNFSNKIIVRERDDFKS